MESLLRANDEFQAAYPDARLVWVESNRGVPENRQGRYYLRYHHDHGATEFWGYLSSKPRFDFKKGVVGVVVAPDTPKP